MAFPPPASLVALLVHATLRKVTTRAVSLWKRNLEFLLLPDVRSTSAQARSKEHGNHPKNNLAGIVLVNTALSIKTSTPLVKSSRVVEDVIYEYCRNRSDMQLYTSLAASKISRLRMGRCLGLSRRKFVKQSGESQICHLSLKNSLIHSRLLLKRI